MLARRQVRLRRDDVGRTVGFGDGSRARVYRETVVLRDVEAPCLLVVVFRLRAVRGETGHALFRWESLLNTPLFVGFPGFVSKLWLAADDDGRYRGLYEWDGAEQAQHYARSLWRVLELVCEPGSIDYRVVPGVGRDTAMARPRADAGPDESWWQVVRW